jgi:hypothetical protein
LVVAPSDWVPFNEFDCEFAYFVEVSGIASEMAEYAYKITANQKGEIAVLVGNFSRQFDLKPSDTRMVIVLKHAILRYLFDFRFLNHIQETENRIVMERFIEKSHFIASCSPRLLGIPEHLLTPAQLDPPLFTLVRTSATFREIANDLSSLQFFNSPADAVYILQSSFQKLDELVRRNALERKLGQFMPMVDPARPRRKLSFMSFDDCFSLFSAILAVDPPSNALAICEICDRLSGLSAAVAAPAAIAMFTTAVQHICDFSADQLVPAEGEVDPLGIALEGN